VLANGVLRRSMLHGTSSRNRRQPALRWRRKILPQVCTQNSKDILRKAAEHPQ
jgi:hypothetical protein